MAVAGLSRPNGSYVDRDVGAIAMSALHEFFQRKAFVRGDNRLAGDAKILLRAVGSMATGFPWPRNHAELHLEND